MPRQAQPRSQHSYVRRSVRRGGRVSTRYLGRAGDAAVQVAMEAARLRRVTAQDLAQEVRAEQRTYAAVLPQIIRLARQLQLVKRVLIITQQPTQEGTSSMPHTSTETHSTHATDGLPTREHLRYLARRAERGDEEAAARLRHVVRSHREIWEPIGDLSQHVQVVLIDLIAPKDLVLRESLRMTLADMRRALLAEARPGLLAELLVEHVLATFLECQLARMGTVQAQHNRGGARFWEEQYERAQARHLGAIQALLECISAQVSPPSPEKSRDGHHGSPDCEHHS